MNRRSAKHLGVGLIMMMLIGVATHPAPVLADSTLKGTFTGKVMCQDGKKKAEFKTDTLIVTFYSSQEIKKRVDDLTWPGPSETASFSEREKEKTTLQHALKLLRELDCDAATAPVEPPTPFPAKPQPSDVTPKPTAPPMHFIQ